MAGTGLDARFRDEVLALHRFLDGWLRGEIARRDGQPTHLEAALASEFSVIHPGGRRQGRREVLRNFARARGEKPADYALQIDLHEVRVLAGGLALAVYTETHRGEAGRSRICSALLRHRPAEDRIEWLHLHETMLDGST